MNQTQEQQTDYPDDEIDLRELFATLWKGKWLIIAITFLFAVGGVAYALDKPDIYQASALLSPTQSQDGGRIGGQLGGLASLAGLNIGGADSNKTTIAIEVLRSRAFLTDFIHRHNLSVFLMATDAWSQKEGKWVYATDVYNRQTDDWATDEEGKTLKPTDWDLVKKFSSQLSINKSKDNGMITVAIESLSPISAQQWVEWLIKDINDHMRKQDVVEAEARINYLEAKLRETSIAGMQQVFYQLIEQETRTIMLANAQGEYVFKTLDPAIVPQEKTGPKRALICVAAAMLGCLIGMFAVILRAFIYGEKSDREEGAS